MSGALTVEIDGTAVQVVERSFSIDDSISSVSTVMFTVRDDTGANHYTKGQQVAILDSVNGLKYTGFVSTVIEDRASPNTLIFSQIGARDNHYLAEKRTYDGPEFTNVPAGIIFCAILDTLAKEGITAEYASRRDFTNTDFNAGTLSSVTGTSNVGDGDLELSLAGTAYSKVETSTSDFASGTLSSVTAANNELAITSSKAVKMTGTAAQNLSGNLFSYVKIWSGSQGIAAGDYLSYDVWISSTSPQIMGGIDFLCTDGTTFRDSGSLDQFQMGCHPNANLDGFANDQWFSRKIGIAAALAGKTIASVMIVLEGDSSGDYTVYCRTVKLYDNSNALKATFFSSSLATNQQMQNSGYAAVSVSVATVYERTGQRTSSSYSISAPGIVAASTITWTETVPAQPTGGAASTLVPVLIETSWDGDASFQACTNGGAIPGLLAGTNLGSKTLLIRETLSIAGPSPELTPSLQDVEVSILPSYACSKSDAQDSSSIYTSGLNAGSLTNVTTVGGVGNQISGAYKTWDDGDVTTSQTLFGATNPAVADWEKTIAPRTDSGTDVKVRFDFAGTWQDFVAEIDILTPTNVDCGLDYRTSTYANANNTFGYNARLTPTAVELWQGTNGGGGSPLNRVATTPITLTANTWYRMKVVVSGNSHQISINDVLYINTTDATYVNTSKVGVRVGNSSGARQSGFFDNFGIMSSAFTGTRVHNALNCNACGVVTNSVIQWNAVVPTNTTLLVEAKIDSGSYVACTNGAVIPGITPGTSMVGHTVTIRETYTTNNANATPTLLALTAYVAGNFNATGTRISPSLSLESISRIGGSVVAWNSALPSGCTLGVDTSVGNVGENSYGITVGINTPNYPVVPRLSQTAVNWAQADGHQNFRFQINISLLWRNQADTTGNAGGWDFAPLDDAVYKLTQAGFTISFPLRGFPSWALANVTYQSTDEPHFMPDPAYVLICAQVIASRYNGVFNIPTYGPMKIHKLELGNEEFNIAFTSSTQKVVLNQNVNSGSSYASVAITASTIAVPNGVWMQFGTSGGSGDTVKLTSAIAIGDTTVHISATGGGTYTAAHTAASGSNFTVVYRGLRTSPYAIYDGHLGVLNAANPTPQPSRDPWYLQQVINTVGPVMAASYPWLRIGAGAIWWMWDDNFTDFIAGLGSALQYVEFLNFHYYSNAVDPHTGSGHVPSITTAITNMQAAAAGAGYPNVAIECTEFGWQTYTIATTAHVTISAGVRTITPASMSGITTSTALLIDEFGTNPETVTPSATTATTFTATFAQAHSGTWTIGGNGDCSETTQASRYTSFFADVLATGKCRRVYLFTYDASTNPVSSSLYRWNGSSYHEMAALAIVRNQIATTPYLIGSAASWTDQTAQNGQAIAGLLAQPTAYFDSFESTGTVTYAMRAFGSTLIRSSNTAANYIQTNYGGGSNATWTWDTTNSRILGAGGTRAVLQRVGAVFTDGSVYADMDYADGNGTSSPGVFMRMADTSHLYFVKVNDASSGFNPNTLGLFVKNGAGAATQIGTNAAIAFVRGTYHRVKMEIVGTTITVSFDGTPVIITADATLAAAGLAGILDGVQVRCYQLSIQPYGQSGVGLNVQTRLRLASTNPLATPAVTDLSIAAFGRTIAAGATIPQTSMFHTYLDQCIANLATASNYWFNIDKNRLASFLPQDAVPAPWVASDGGAPVSGVAQGDFLDASITVEDASDLYRNRQIVDKVLAPVTINEKRIGDGVSRSWTFGNQWAGPPTIAINGVALPAVLVGVKNVDTGKAFYYAVGDPTIVQDSSGQLYNASYTLTFTGPGQYLTYSQVDDVAGQAIRASIEGIGTGIVTNVVDGTGMTKAQGDTLAQGLIDRYSIIGGRLLKATTRRDGLAPGQQLTVFLPDHGIWDKRFLIRSVRTTTTTEGPTGAMVQQGWYAIEAISGGDIGDWTRLYKRDQFKPPL